MILWFGKKKKKDPKTGETPVEPRPPEDAGIEAAPTSEKQSLLSGMFGGAKAKTLETAAAIDGDEDAVIGPQVAGMLEEDASLHYRPSEVHAAPVPEPPQPYKPDTLGGPVPDHYPDDEEEPELRAAAHQPEAPDFDETHIPAHARDEQGDHIEGSKFVPPASLLETPADEEDALGAYHVETETAAPVQDEPVSPTPIAQQSAPELQTDDPLEEVKKPGFFARMTQGLRKSSSKLADGITSVFTKKKLDDETLQELEDLLISSDLGASVAMRVCENIRQDRFDKEITDEEVKQALAVEITKVLEPREEILDLSEGETPRVVLFVGVNGSGKTTTIGKIAAKLSAQGANILCAAGDTFRAAAVEQLKIWSERANAGFISRPHGADSAGLAYDAVQQAKQEGRDLVLIDTAGRLQNKSELMDELAKVVRAIRKVDANAPHDVILVLDATVGQNALSQVEAFKHTAGVSGLVMTKLDGTAKGGVLVAIADKHSIPIHFVGVGESAEDLYPFSAKAFSQALVGLSDTVTTS